MNVRSPLLALACAILFLPAARAELSHYQDRTLLAAITDGSDPFGRGVWDPLRDIPAVHFLNPDGSDRGDGPPDIKWDEAGIPHVVWAYRNGSQKDIAYSYWTGNRWSDVEFLEQGHAADSADPRIHVGSDGTLYVAWWTEGAMKVFTTRKAPESPTWAPPRIFAQGGKRPSLATHDGVMRVVYEVTLGDWNTNAIAVVREGSVAEIFVPTDRDERLDPIIHSLCDKLWIDYKRTRDELGVLLLESAPATGNTEDDDAGLVPPWATLDPEPWLDPSWVGVEFARRAVQLRVLAPTGVIAVEVPPPLRPVDSGP